TTSVRDAIRAAHGAGYYDAASLTKYLNLLNKASLFVPGSTSEIARSLAYFQMVSKNVLGMSDQNTIMAVALADRLGFGGSRGGRNLTAALTRSIPGVFGSGLFTGKSNQALAAMHMVDAAGHARVFKGGRFDMATWMGLTADYVAREFASHPGAVARQDIMRNFQHAYGTIGSRLTAALASPRAIGQWRAMAARFSELGGFEGMQQTFASQSVAQQWQNAKTNFMSAMTELGITLLPTASAALRKLNTHLGELIGWMTRNPAAVKRYAEDLGIFSAALLGLGALSVATSGILALTTAAGALGTAVRYAAGINAAGIAVNFATLAKSAGLLSASFGGGWAVGSLIWSFIEGTKAADKFGASIAHLFAFFGDKSAQEALRTSAGANAVPTPVPAGYRLPTWWEELEGLVFGRAHGTVTHVTHVHLDGRKVADVVTTHQGRSARAPQTGISGFDMHMSPTPAGAVGLP
ncbi:MAG: hypothetical protein ACRES6_09160, partial [Steroidobacteraceae bacterium]